MWSGSPFEKNKASDSSLNLTAVTYNVHEWIGKDRQQRPERAIRILTELEADVIALQEVSFYSGDARSYTLEDLSQKTGMSVIPGLTLTRKKADFGNLILTAYPLLSVRKLDLTFRAREPRGAIIAGLDIKGTPCTVIATHLGLRWQERRWQIRQLLDEIKSHQSGFVIFMGDFNEWNALTGALRILKPHFHMGPSPPTYPSRFPVLPLDRILVRPGSALKEISVHKTPFARQASDHLPVKAVIRSSFS